MISRRDFLKLTALCAASLCSGGALGGCAAVDEVITGKRILTDDTGRTVTMPAPSGLNSIYFTSPLAQIFCFTLAPDLLAGTSILFTKQQLEFLPVGTEKLPYLGSLTQGRTIDADMLKYQGVQLIFSISGTDLTDVNIADALNLEKQANIPVFLIDGSFDVIGDTYRLLGRCLDRAERAEKLASYCEDIYSRVTAAVAKVPDSELVRYYFAEGPEGLQTEPNASQHSLSFQVARGANTAATLSMPEGVRDMVNVDIKQVQAWDPDVIICWDNDERNGAANLIRASSEWSGIKAVRDGRVHVMPNLPFALCDRPPGVNRFLGIQWLANLFYPDYYDVDMVEVVREFYATCYWRDISRAQAERILHHGI